MLKRLTACVLVALTFGMSANAQTSVSLGGISAETGEPISVDAQTLSVDQASGQAVFAGDVVVAQGDLRLGAGQVVVHYADGGGITRLVAGGGVTFATPSDAAEARDAVYDLGSGLLVLTGEVLLSQGALAISADRMEIDLTAATARLSGNVRTVFGVQ